MAGRVVQGHDRNRHGPRPPQGLRRCTQRRHRRPYRDAVRRHHHHGANRAGGPGARARHQRGDALHGVTDVPTIAEAGVPGFEATIWLGIVAPAGTPKAIVDKLNAAINQTIKRPEIIAAWERQALSDGDAAGGVEMPSCGRTSPNGRRWRRSRAPPCSDPVSLRGASRA